MAAASIRCPRRHRKVLVRFFVVPVAPLLAWRSELGKGHARAPEPQPTRGPSGHKALRPASFDALSSSSALVRNRAAASLPRIYLDVIGSNGSLPNEAKDQKWIMQPSAIAD